MNLNKMLYATCEKYPKSTVIIYKNNTVLYKKLDEYINRLTHSFITLGVKPGDRVAIILRNSPEFIITYFALMRLGAIAVPVNFLLKPPETEFILRDAQTVGIVTHLSFFHDVKAAGRNVPDVRFFIIVGYPNQIKTSSDGIAIHQAVISYSKLLSESSAEPYHACDDIGPETVAMFIYTSGTTGKPKGVMLTHNNLLSNIDACIQATGVNTKDRFICVLPMFHSFAWLVCVLLPLYLGAKIIVVESIKPFGNVMKAIFHHKVTMFVAVPQIFSALTKLPFFRPLNVFVPVQLCISGAAPLPSHVLEKFQKKFNIPLIEGYGLTETSPVVTLNPVKGPRKAGSIGIPVTGVEVKIIDEKGKDISSTTHVGEICVRGPNVMKGYHGRPEETAQVLSKDGWFKTGDMGYIDEDGYIYVVDRKKDLIISKGLNIYPKEVEDVLIQYPSVAEAAVVGVTRADGDEVVIAYIVPREGKSVDIKEMRLYCKKNIASYKVPREIIISSELPKNTLGKVLKTKLREEAAKKYGNK